MKNRFLLIFSSAFVILIGCSKQESLQTPGEDDCYNTRGLSDGDPIPGQYIISLKNGHFTSSRENNSARIAELLDKYRLSGGSILKTFSYLKGAVVQLKAEEAEELRNDPDVAAVEQDRLIALNTCFEVVEPSLISWNINRVGYGDGRGKTAWIIDSGIDFDHPDLNVDKNKSRSFVSGSASADDDHGHGTHVAGIIGGKNNSFGVLGVASGASVVSLKVLDRDGVGTLSSVVDALSYVQINGRAGDVVNLSLGEEGVSQLLDQQVKETASAGIFVAIAAGNDGRPASSFSPARTNGSNIYTVSAVDSLDRFASFSNYGNDVVDFAAPGVHIPSTFYGGRYAKMSGTSMAAPHVAGLLLLRGRNISSSGTAVNDPDGTPDRIAHN